MSKLSATHEHSRDPAESYDVVVIGGGPAGTTFGRYLHRAGQRVLVVERGRHPRFSVGESLIPGTMPVWRELGLVERFEEAGFLRKYGAYFCFQDGREPEYRHFPDATRLSAPFAWGVKRAAFDQVLWNAAVEAGVSCIEDTAVERVVFENHRATGVDLKLAGGRTLRVATRLVADCSGRATVLGRQLGTRVRDPKLDNVALYCHYDDVIRSHGEDAGTIAVVATSQGWTWLIPFAGGGASVGAVVRRDWYGERRKAGLDKTTIWRELLDETPAVSTRLNGSPLTRPVEITADFQYRVRPLAGDGWVIVGDAGAFLDPVFSSGVHLAVTGARTASVAAASALRRKRLPRTSDFRGYNRRSQSALSVYERFIHAWYDPDFREIFIHPPRGKRGLGLLKGEVISVLAGAVSPAWRARPCLDFLLLLAWFRRRSRPVIS